MDVERLISIIISVAYTFLKILCVSTTAEIFGDGSVHKSFWSMWSAWSPCSVTCGIGSQTRHRQCLPPSSHTCRSAESLQSEECVRQTCSADHKESVGAFLGQPTSLHCPLNPRFGIKHLYWLTPLGDRISVDSLTNAGFKASGQMLKILAVTEYSSGTYHCVVIDKNDKTETADIKLVVYTCGDVNPCMHGGTCVVTSKGNVNSPSQSPVRVWCQCPFVYYGDFCEEDLLFIALIAVGVIVICAAIAAICHCCTHMFWAKNAAVPAGSRAEPDGSAGYPTDQYPNLKQDIYDAGLLDDPNAIDDYILEEDDEFDDETPLLQDEGTMTSEVATTDVGLQPSVTEIGRKNIWPAMDLPVTDVPLQPSYTDIGLSTYGADATADAPVSPSQTSAFSRRLLSYSPESYVDSDVDYPRTKMAILKLQQRRRERQKVETSTDDELPTGHGDSGRSFPPFRKSRTPESIATGTAGTEGTLTPGISSTSTFLFDSESVDSDDEIVPTQTLKSIAKMKRQASRRTITKAARERRSRTTAKIDRDTPRLPSPAVQVLELQPAVTKPATVSPMSVGVSSRSPSQTPEALSAVDGTQTVLTSPVGSVPAASPSRPPADTTADVQPGSQSTPVTPTTPTPAGSQVLPGSPAVPDRQPTPVPVPEPVNQIATFVQPVHITIDKMKDVQKVERTDAEGRKTTVYKLTPNAGMWPSFGGGSSNVQPMPGSHVPLVPSASVKLGNAPAVQHISSTGVRFMENRSDGADKQTVYRLRTLANQRGDDMSQDALQEIQGITARPQVRSTRFGQQAALQQSLTSASGEEIATTWPETHQFSSRDRLPFVAGQPYTTNAQQLSSFDYQSSGDNSLAARFFYSSHQPQSAGPVTVGTVNSISNFPHLSGEHSHTEPIHRLTFDVSVPDASNPTNRVASQFLQDRFDNRKKCFRESSSQSYLSRIAVEGLQPETQTLLNRLSEVGVKSDVRSESQVSDLQKIRTSFSSRQQSKPDYPELPSATRLADVGRRLNFVSARPDEPLHPSLNRFTSVLDESRGQDSRLQDYITASGQSADMAKPDEFLHPSLHRVTPASHVISAAPDDALHPSETKLKRGSVSSHIAKYEEALHPSLTRLRDKASVQMSPAAPDSSISPSLSRFGVRRSVTSNTSSVPDQPLHPSTSRLKSILKGAMEPGKQDDYLHPSLTRVQTKPPGPTRGSAKLRSELEAATTTTTHMDREYLLYNEPARQDDILHPSTTRLHTADDIHSTGDFAASVTVVPGLSVHGSDARHSASAQHLMKERAAAGKKDTLPSVTALPDDALRPSFTQFLAQDSPGTIADTVSMDRKESVRPSMTRFSAPTSGQATVDSATSTVDVGRQEILPQVPARPDDVLHPSVTRFSPRDSTGSTLNQTVVDTRTSATAVEQKETLPSIRARQDDVLHPSSTHLPSRYNARTTVDTTTSTTTAGWKETYPSDVHHSSQTQYTARDSIPASLDSETLTIGKDTVTSLPARPDDALYPSSTEFLPRESVETPMDSETSTTTLDKERTRRSVSARAEDALHPSSAKFAPRVSGQSAMDSETSTTTLDREMTRQSISARPDDVLHPSSTKFPPHERGQTAMDSGTSTTTLDREMTRQSISARPDDVIHPSSTKFPPPERGQTVMDSGTSTTTLDKERQRRSVSARPDDVLHPSSTQYEVRDSARSTLDSGTSTTGLIRHSTLPPVPFTPADSTDRSSTEFLPHGSARTTLDTGSSSTDLDRKETLPTVTAKSGDVLRHSSTVPENAPSTLDSRTSTTTLSRKDRFPSLSARVDDILHPSSSQLPRRESAQATLDSATSTTAIDRKETLPLVLPRDVTHSASVQFPSRSSSRALLDTGTSSADLQREQTSVTAKPDDVLHPLSTQFTVPESARTTLDGATSTRPTTLGRKDTFPPVSARLDDILHPSSNQLHRRETVRATLDSATSTTGIDRKKTLLSMVDGMTYSPSAQFQPHGNAALLDTGTSTADLQREDPLRSVSARPDDILHPSSTQFARRVSGRTTATSTTAVGEDVTVPAVSARLDDVMRPSATEFSAPDSATETSHFAARSVTHHGGYEDGSVSLVDTGSRPSRRISDVDGGYGGTSMSRREPPHPSEFMHPSLTVVGDERTVADIAVRPSTRSVTDLDYSGRSFMTDWQSVVGEEPRTEARVEISEAPLDDDYRRQSVAPTDEMRTSRRRLPSDISRSSLRTGSERRHQTLPAGPATLSESAAKTDSSRKQRTVTWDLSPRAMSDVDIKAADSDSSAGYRSLPSVLDAESQRRTSGGDEMADDGSYTTPAGERTSTTSDLISGIGVRARDSRVVREHFGMKIREDSSKSDAVSDKITGRLMIEDMAVEDEPSRPIRSDYTTPTYRCSSERASAMKISGECAAADAPVPPSSRLDFAVSAREDKPLSTSVNEFRSTEDTLLKCPRASVSRPPCGDLDTVPEETVSWTTLYDARGQTCSVGEQEGRAVVDDQATKSALTSTSLPQPPVSGCDVTNSMTFYNITENSVSSQAPCYSRSCFASQAAYLPDERPPAAVSRMVMSRAGTDCYSRLAGSTRWPDSTCTDGGVYRSPLAPYRSVGSTFQPCQPSCQSLMQQSQRCPPSLQSQMQQTRRSGEQTRDCRARLEAGRNDDDAGTRRGSNSHGPR